MYLHDRHFNCFDHELFWSQTLSMNCSHPNTLSMKYLCPVVNLGENLALTKVWSTVCPVYVTWALSYNREHLSFFSSSEYETHQWDSFQRKLFEKTGLTTLESPSTLRLHPATLRGTLKTDKISLLSYPQMPNLPNLGIWHIQWFELHMHKWVKNIGRWRWRFSE